ncbi:hypothetical protein ACFSCX_20835 [Bacillus salitolerans]|uniref:Lipoprotein n=1 Tax=Bacillus salitolerans TaxID=1437434 RepID=A0ABW4LV02_9BACI
MKIVLLLIFLLVGCSTYEDTNHVKENQANQPESNIEDHLDATPNTPGNKPDAKFLLREYKERFMKLVHESDNQEITSFRTKEEIKSHFKEIMSDEYADWLTNTYFKEQNDAVFIIAKDSPTWFQPVQDHTLEPLNEKTYMLIQKRENELLGHVNFYTFFKQRENKWIIDSIEVVEYGNLSRREAEKLVEDELQLQNDNEVIIEFDHLEGKQYVIHVYDIVDGHTATRSWYIVNPTTGEIKNMMNM